MLNLARLYSRPVSSYNILYRMALMILFDMRLHLAP
jgi:hypothetical protein